MSNIQTFLSNLQKSNLLSSKELADIREATGSDAKPSAVAKQLLKMGILTEWQANRLLAGNHTFFVGKYKLLKRLGGGKSAAVFKADQPVMHRPVAIKVLPKEFAKDEEAMERFRREVQATASLSHDNIVKVYEAGHIGSIPYMVVEYVGGRDLSAWLKKYNKLPIPWACEVARQIARGLEQVHENGLVHRDISPSNILVIAGEDLMPTAKILDFGRVRSLGKSLGEKQLTVQGQMLGTPDYMAPEQARNSRAADIRSDIYSLGSTLYQLVTGHLPHEQEDPLKKLTALFSEEVPAASTHLKSIPSTLDGIISKMLAKDPDARYQTPTEVVHALGPFALGGEEIFGMDDSESEIIYEGIPYEEEEEWQVAELVEDEPQQEENPNVYEFLGKLANEAN